MIVSQMNQATMKLIALGLLSAFLMAPVVAQERAGRHALIIGVSNYQDPTAPSL